jgi:hypothetical protein
MEPDSPADGTEFEVAIQADNMTSFLGSTPCAYFEWEYGDQEGSGWISTGYVSEQPVSLLANGTSLSMPPIRLRLFLRPQFERDYSQGDQGMPDVVRAALTEKGAARIHVEEYVLRTGVRYFARYQTEYYPLPGPGGGITHGSNRVLQISDQSFSTLPPDTRLTPATRSIVY